MFEGDDFDRDLLVSLANSLGETVTTKEGKKIYVKSDDCVDTLKDLQRFLRRDDVEEFPVLRLMSRFNIAKRDLIPLIKMHPDGTEIVYNAVKVATLMTMPPEPGDTADPDGLFALQRSVREAFLDEDALALVVSLAIQPLAKFPKMSESDSLMVQLVLSFIRNLLVIPLGRRLASASASSLDGGAASRDAKSALLAQLVDTGAMDLLITCAQHCERNPFKQDALLLLEVFDEVFSAYAPCEIIEASEEMARKGLSLDKKAKREAAEADVLLAAALSAERVGVTKVTAPPARHSRFVGIIQRGGFGGAGASLISTARPGALTGTALKPVQNVAAGRGGTKKVALGDPGAKGGAGPARTDIQARIKSQADQFLDQGSFDILMSELKRDFMRGVGMGRMEKVDVLRFLRLSAFFTEYCRRRVEHHRSKQQKDAAARQRQGQPAAPPEPLTKDGTSPFGHVTSVLSYDMFKEVYDIWQGESDKPVSVEDKDWSMMHVSCRLYKEMLFGLDAAIKHGTPSDIRAADRMQRRLLHNNLKDSGLVPLLARAVKAYDWKREGVLPAHSLIECIHVVLKTLDRLAEGGALVRVKARAVVQRKKKKAEGEGEEAGAKEGAEAGAEGAAAEEAGAGEEAPAAPRRRLALMDEDEDEGAEGGGGGGAAQPTPTQPAAEGTTPGDRGAAAGDLSPAEPAMSGASPAGRPAGKGKGKGGAEGEGEGVEGEGEEDVDGGLTYLYGGAARQDPRAMLEGYDDDETSFQEISLDVVKMVRQNFAHSDVLLFYTQILKQYKANPRHINHYLVTFFRRISGSGPRDLNLMPMLWQLSMLRVFHAIVADQSIYDDRRFQDLLTVSQQVAETMMQVLLTPAAGKEEEEEKEKEKEKEGQGAAGDAAAAPQGDAAGAEAHDGAAAAAAAAEDDDAAGSDREGAAAAEGDSAPRKVSAWEREMRSYQRRIAEVTARAAFVELLFWKTPKCAEDMLDQYGYKERLEKEIEAGPRGGGRGRRANSPGGAGGAGDSDADIDVEEVLRGIRARTRGGPKGGSRLLTEMEIEDLKEAFGRHSGDKNPAAKICEEAAFARFAVDQIARQLRQLGLVQPRAKAAPHEKAARSCAALIKAKGIDGGLCTEWLLSKLSECAEYWEEEQALGMPLDEDFWLIPTDRDEEAYVTNRSFGAVCKVMGLRAPAAPPAEGGESPQPYWAIPKDKGPAGCRNIAEEVRKAVTLARQEISNAKADQLSDSDFGGGFESDKGKRRDRSAKKSDKSDKKRKRKERREREGEGDAGGDAARRRASKAERRREKRRLRAQVLSQGLGEGGAAMPGGGEGAEGAEGAGRDEEGRSGASSGSDSDSDRGSPRARAPAPAPAPALAGSQHPLLLEGTLPDATLPDDFDLDMGDLDDDLAGLDALLGGGGKAGAAGGHVHVGAATQEPLLMEEPLSAGPKKRKARQAAEEEEMEEEEDVGRKKKQKKDKPKDRRPKELEKQDKKDKKKRSDRKKGAEEEEDGSARAAAAAERAAALAALAGRGRRHESGAGAAALALASQNPLLEGTLAAGGADGDFYNTSSTQAMRGLLEGTLPEGAGAGIRRLARMRDQPLTQPVEGTQGVLDEDLADEAADGGAGEGAMGSDSDEVVGRGPAGRKAVLVDSDDE